MLGTSENQKLMRGVVWIIIGPLNTSCERGLVIIPWVINLIYIFLILSGKNKSRELYTNHDV
jgi:hypothetical protein